MRTSIPAARCRGVFNQFSRLAPSLHVLWFAPAGPQHHLQVNHIHRDESTTTERSLEYGTGAGTVLGAPRAPPGERGIFWLLWLVRISTAVRLPALSIRQEHTSRVVAILTQWQASMVARMQGRASLATTLGVDTDIVSSTRDACKS